MRSAYIVTLGCLAIPLVSSVASAQGAAQDAVSVGAQRQLFIDDFIVDRMEGVERVFHPATKHPEPVIVPDKPWETPSFIGGVGNCVFFDDEDKLYKMYYVIYYLLDKGEHQKSALAVSRDGLHWEKPSLGVANYKGSNENNLLWDFDIERLGYNNVIKDLHDPDPARRYKALGGPAVHVAVSPDGVHWTEPPESPVLQNSDTHTLLGWDDRIGKYVAYPRTAYPRAGVRSIGYSTSDDFVHWTPAETVMWPGPEDSPNYQIYGMPVFKYEGVYIGLPWAFIAAGTEPLDTQLAFSRDGIAWQKVAGGAMFIPRGPAGSMDDTYAVSANPVVVGDELWFYYMAAGFPHGPQYWQETKFPGVIGLARLRLDGFVSLDCPLDQGGTVVTKPLSFEDSRLVVNCNCPNGWLRVELQNADGTPIPGFTEADCDVIRADSVRQEVTWKGNGDVSALRGQAVRMKLHIGDGQLYSFGFTP